jgi:hypothetical protein
MLLEPYTGAGLGHHGCERGFADLKRVAAKVIVVQFDQVEGVQKGAVVYTVVTDQIERRHAFSEQATASPSMMYERARSLAMVSTISGKRSVRSLPGG